MTAEAVCHFCRKEIWFSQSAKGPYNTGWLHKFNSENHCNNTRTSPRAEPWHLSVHSRTLTEKDWEAHRFAPVPPEPSLSASALTDDFPRTLLYGYDCERRTWHVYLDKSGLIVKAVYTSQDSWGHHRSNNWPIAALLPDKRLYPEYCDLETVRMIRAKGVQPPFTIWKPPTRPGPFYGEIR